MTSGHVWEAFVETEAARSFWRDGSSPPSVRLCPPTGVSLSVEFAFPGSAERNPHKHWRPTVHKDHPQHPAGARGLKLTGT